MSLKIHHEVISSQPDVCGLRESICQAVIMERDKPSIYNSVIVDELPVL